MRWLEWYFGLPVINKCVGVSDNYGTGIVRHIDFRGECTVVWVEYKTKSIAFSYR